MEVSLSCVSTTQKCSCLLHWVNVLVNVLFKGKVLSQIQRVRILKCNVFSAASLRKALRSSLQRRWNNLSESLKYLPAYVEADCCRDCNCPRLQLYLFATVPKGTSFTRSCSTRVVKNLRASERKEDGNYKGFSQTKEYTFSSNEIYPLFVWGLGFFPVLLIWVSF